MFNIRIPPTTIIILYCPLLCDKALQIRIGKPILQSHSKTVITTLPKVTA